MYDVSDAESRKGKVYEKVNTTQLKH